VSCHVGHALHRSHLCADAGRPSPSRGLWALSADSRLMVTRRRNALTCRDPSGRHSTFSCPAAMLDNCAAADGWVRARGPCSTCSRVLPAGGCSG
jgi:hypothetical protein